jgi:hypothetical protein
VTDQMQTVREDLAFLKTVATDEGQLPWYLGASFFFASLIWGLPVVAIWAQQSGLMFSPGPWEGWIWLVATVVYIPFQIGLMLLSPKPKPGASTGRAFLPTWAGMGLITVVMVAVIFIAGVRMHDRQVWQIWTSLIFAVWGGAWLGVAMLRPRHGWMWIALGSFANAMVNAFLINTPNETLGCAVGILLWMGGPGVMIMLNARTRD